MKLLVGYDDLRPEFKKDGLPVGLSGERSRPTFKMLTERAQKAVKFVGEASYVYPNVSFGDVIYPPLTT